MISLNLRPSTYNIWVLTSSHSKTEKHRRNQFDIVGKNLANISPTFLPSKPNANGAKMLVRFPHLGPFTHQCIWSGGYRPLCFCWGCEVLFDCHLDLSTVQIFFWRTDTQRTEWFCDKVVRSRRQRWKHRTLFLGEYCFMDGLRDGANLSWATFIQIEVWEDDLINQIF